MMSLGSAFSMNTVINARAKGKTKMLPEKSGKYSREMDTALSGKHMQHREAEESKGRMGPDELPNFLPILCVFSISTQSL